MTPLTKATKPTKANICCTFIINAIMLIMFGIYSFNNPDDSDCYVVHILGEYYSYNYMPDNLDHNDIRNVGKDFEIIFICGFVMCLINLVYAFLGIVYFMKESKQIEKFT